jgi:sodium pump decarboxylase, gamma subunit
MMAGCSLSLTKTNKNFNKKTLETNADSFVTSWFSYDFESAVKSMKEQSTEVDEDTVNQYKESIQLKKKYGKQGTKVDTDFTISSDSATVVETYTTSSGKKLIFSVTYDEKGQTSSWKVEEYKSLGDKMAKAGLNTVLSMAIVFAVLIFIAIIIAQFKHIGNFQNGAKKEEVKAEPVVEAAPVVEEENLVDDLELVAVITAAIAAASETESADGLVIRSIIRR